MFYWPFTNCPISVSTPPSQPSTTWPTSSQVPAATQPATSWTINEAALNQGASYHSGVLPPLPLHFNLSNGHDSGPSTYMGYPHPDATHVPPVDIPCRGHFLRCTGGCGSSCAVPSNLAAASRQTNLAGFRQHGYHNQPFGLADAFSPSITGQNNPNFYEVLDISPNFNTVYSGIHTTGLLGHGSRTQPSPYPDEDFGRVSGGYSQLSPAENDSRATELWNIDPILLNVAQAGELFEEQPSMSLTDDTSPPQRLPSSPSDEAISPYSTSGESSEDELTAHQPQVSAKSLSPSEIRLCPFCKSFKGDARALRFVQQP